MNLKALVDFNKYSLTFAAACFVYTLERYTPQHTDNMRSFIVVLLCVFLLSAICGVLVFSAATAGQAADKVRAERAVRYIPIFGQCHAVLLVVGLLALALPVFKDATSVSKDIDCNLARAQCPLCK